MFSEFSSKKLGECTLGILFGIKNTAKIFAGLFEDRSDEIRIGIKTFLFEQRRCGLLHALARDDVNGAAGEAETEAARDVAEDRADKRAVGTL